MENLEKDKKINEKILDILLKNATLIGNFIIRCTPYNQIRRANRWGLSLHLEKVYK